MDSNHAPGISGRLLREVEGDASQFHSAEPQYAPSAVNGVPVLLSAPAGWMAQASLTRESAAVAKAAWVRVLKRFTEPMAGDEGCVQIPVTPENGDAYLSIE